MRTLATILIIVWWVGIVLGFVCWVAWDIGYDCGWNARDEDARHLEEL